MESVSGRKPWTIVRRFDEKFIANFYVYTYIPGTLYFLSEVYLCWWGDILAGLISSGCSHDYPLCYGAFHWASVSSCPVDYSIPLNHCSASCKADVMCDNLTTTGEVHC